MLVVLALAVPVQMLAQGSKAEKQVRAAMDELRQANLKSDAVLFDKLLADDFVRIPANGVVYTKANVLDDERSGKQRTEAFETSDVKIQPYGNTAVVTGVLSSKSAGPLVGSDTLRPRQFRFTRVFVKRNGVWQCILYQSTLIKED
jgi:hypothetical protein